MSNFTPICFVSSQCILHKIISTDLLLTKIKFNGMKLNKENDNSTVGRTQQDRANIKLSFRVVHRWQHVSLNNSTACETNMAN